jgi:hypothetical protein
VESQPLWPAQFGRSATVQPALKIDGPSIPFRPTGHSPRRGLTTSSKRAGNDRKVIAKQGGWADNSAAMEGYFEDGDGWEDNALIGVL